MFNLYQVFLLRNRETLIRKLFFFTPVNIYKDTKAVFNRVYIFDIQSVMSVFSTPIMN